jgi:hypothetical protein
MKLTITQLRKIIKEEHALALAHAGGRDPQRFLHGEDPQDSEGSMAKSKLLSLRSMSQNVCDILQGDDQLPGWVQDHISVAHENLRQVHGYLMGVAGGADEG